MSSQSLSAFLQDNLTELSDKGSIIPSSLLKVRTVRSTIQGREFVNLSSNNYLGLANDERLKKRPSGLRPISEPEAAPFAPLTERLCAC